MIGARNMMGTGTKVSGSAGAFSALIIMSIVAVGCENVALVGRPEVKSRANGSQLAGTVEELDFERQEIYLRTEGGQTQIVSYGPETRISIDAQEAPASRIRQGDALEVRLRQAPDRRAMAESIRVQAGSPRRASVEGKVERVLSQRGVLELRTAEGKLMTIYLPPGSAERIQEQFGQIRVGDSVRFQGVFLNGDRFEASAVL